MKKKLTLIVLVLICSLALSACGCRHKTWVDANCETPKTCAECGEIEGAPLGHIWAAATCETAKTCSVCNQVKGEALGHTWLDATTEAPKTCETCAKTEGERIVTDPRFTTAATADIQGKWVYTVDVTGEMLGEPNFNGTISVTIMLELMNDGIMAVHMEMSDTTDLEEHVMNALYEEFAAEGFDKDTVDILIQNSTGMTVEQFVKNTITQTVNDKLLSSDDFGNVYYVEDGLLYIGLTWESEMTGNQFALEGDTLTMSMDVEKLDYFGIDGENMVFTRVVDAE